MCENCFFIVWWSSNLFGPKQKKEKRPAARPKKILDINELHDFNDILEVNWWTNEKCIEFYEKLAVPIATQKRFSN